MPQVQDAALLAVEVGGCPRFSPQQYSVTRFWKVAVEVGRALYRLVDVLVSEHLRTYLQSGFVAFSIHGLGSPPWCESGRCRPERPQRVRIPGRPSPDGTAGGRIPAAR